jgi:hypothetical protein
LVSLVEREQVLEAEVKELKSRRSSPALGEMDGKALGIIRAAAAKLLSDGESSAGEGLLKASNTLENSIIARDSFAERYSIEGESEIGLLANEITGLRGELFHANSLNKYISKDNERLGNEVSEKESELSALRIINKNTGNRCTIEDWEKASAEEPDLSKAYGAIYNAVGDVVAPEDVTLEMLDTQYPWKTVNDPSMKRPPGESKKNNVGTIDIKVDASDLDEVIDKIDEATDRIDRANVNYPTACITCNATRHACNFNEKIESSCLKCPWWMAHSEDGK